MLNPTTIRAEELSKRVTIQKPWRRKITAMSNGLIIPTTSKMFAPALKVTARSSSTGKPRKFLNWNTG